MSLCELGSALRQLGDFKRAAESFFEAKRLCESNNFKYEKGSLADRCIHRYLDECRDIVAGRLALVVKMTKITSGGQADRLGVREGDIWCALDEWKASDYPDGRGLWSSLVKFMEGFRGRQRRLTVYRMDNGKWIKKSFLFDGSAGGFVYGYDVVPAADYNAMKGALP